MNPDWIIPDWPVPTPVRAVCTTRAGGVSRGPYDSLNLGDHVGDEPLAVVQNRARLTQAVGVPTVFLQQVHGLAVADLDAPVTQPCVADAAVVTRVGMACTVMVADCLPVLLATADGMVVAAAHAGWRGLAGGVLEAACQQVRSRSGADVLAWLGPCIGPRVFEVGPEVRAAFAAVNPLSTTHFTDVGAGKYLADLAALARQRLRAAGVAGVHGNDSSTAWCTVRHPSRFFSFRRDGVTGRMAGAIWLD